jgi:hypothetical protein
MNGKRVFPGLALVFLAAGAAAQERPAQPPPVNSPEVQADRKIVFRILAPKAQTVALQAGDILNLPKGGLQFEKNDKGIWEATAPTSSGSTPARSRCGRWPAASPALPPRWAR